MELPLPLLQNNVEADEEIAVVVAGVKLSLSDTSSSRDNDFRSPRKDGGPLIESANYYAVLDEIDCEIDVVEHTEEGSTSGNSAFQSILIARDSLKATKEQKKKQ